jgi:hypothetical protein
MQIKTKKQKTETVKLSIELTKEQREQIKLYCRKMGYFVNSFAIAAMLGNMK